MEIKSICDLRKTMREGQYAWPGGYPRYFVSSDGEALSFAAVRANLRIVFDSIACHINDGWRVVAVEINWEDEDLTCAHSGQKIESAYGGAD